MVIMMAQLESTFELKYEVNSTNLHIKRESNITSDDFDATNVEFLNKNYENIESEIKLKQEDDDKTEHTFVHICDKKFTIKKELDVTEQQQETDRAQQRVESTHECKQRELLINKYEDIVFKDVENFTIKSEILDIIEQPDEADLQVTKPIINIKENESDEEGTVDNVSKASDRSGDEDPVEHKDIEVCEAIKQEWKDFSATPLSYWSNGLPFDKELRVVLEDVMLTAGKQNTQGTFGEATNNNVSYLKAQSVKKGPTVNMRSLAKSNNMGSGSASTIEAAKFIYPGHENLHGFQKNTNKKVFSRTSTINSNIVYHYDAESSKHIFICDICNNSYQNKTSLYQHIQRHLNLFNCTYCSYTGHDKSDLNKHINIKHTKRTVYSCSYCSYRAYARNTLTKHVNSKHTKETVYYCSYCSYKTYVSSILNSHVNSKHTKNTVYYCSYCSYSTCLKSTLSRHVNCKHSKNTVYNCSYCDYKTFHKGGLNSHINAIHTKTNVFNCSYCDHKTYHKNTLVKHIISKHNKNTV